MATEWCARLMIAVKEIKEQVTSSTSQSASEFERVGDELLVGAEATAHPTGTRPTNQLQDELAGSGSLQEAPSVGVH